MGTADRLVVDGSHWSGDGLDRLRALAALARPSLPISDFALMRQARWREAVASIFDRDEFLPYLRAIRRIAVTYATHGGPGTEAATNLVKPIYHVAWLASRLDLRVAKPLARVGRPAGAGAKAPRSPCPGAPPDPGRGLRALLGRETAGRRWRSWCGRSSPAMPGGTTLRLELLAERRGSELRAEVTAEAESVHVRVWQDGVEALDRTFHAARRTDADLLAEAIEAGGRDRGGGGNARHGGRPGRAGGRGRMTPARGRDAARLPGDATGRRAASPRSSSGPMRGRRRRPSRHASSTRSRRAPPGAGEPTSPRRAARRRPPSTGPCWPSRFAPGCRGASFTSGSATTASSRAAIPTATWARSTGCCCRATRDAGSPRRPWTPPTSTPGRPTRRWPPARARRRAPAGSRRPSGRRCRPTTPGGPSSTPILVGIGADGHLLSVFPESAAFDAPGWTTWAPAPTHIGPHLDRVTLAPSALDATPGLVVAAFGAGKTGIVAELLGPRHAGPDRDERRLPALRARRAGATWVLDAAAARGLGDDDPGSSP